MCVALETAYPNSADMPPEVEGVYDTMLWFGGIRTDDDIRAYFDD